MALTVDPRPIRPGYSSQTLYTVHAEGGACVGNIVDTGLAIVGRIQVDNDLDSIALAKRLRAAGLPTYWRRLTDAQATLAAVQ